MTGDTHAGGHHASAASWARPILTAVACLLLAGVISISHQNVVRLIKESSLSKPNDVLPSPEAIKLCAIGYDQLIADWYWLNFVQYVGDTESRQKDRFAAADQYISLIVGLDPHFIQAYWFAAFIIGCEQGNPRRAAEIVEQGISANQDNWYLPFIAGINQYLFAHDTAAAAKYYRMAGKFPNAPSWLERQAHILEADIPSVIKDINSWDSIYQSSKDTLVKQKARFKLIDLWYRVYKSASSTEQIKKRAANSLKELGADPFQR